MTEQLREIGSRLSALRSIAEMTPELFCEKAGVTARELAAYENGEKDFSFSFLHNAAQLLGVDVIDLLTGESPKLSSCCVVRKGQGLAIDRRAAYSYKHLAYTFRDKKAEPFLVAVAPAPDDKPALHAHEGQEFNLMLSGAMTFYIGEISYDLNEGDSVYFDSSIPHAMKALGNAPATFLAVVVN